MNPYIWALRICGFAAWMTTIVLIIVAWQEVHAAELVLVGNAIGSGLSNLTVTADWINATGNATSWQIIAGGWPT